MLLKVTDCFGSIEILKTARELVSNHRSLQAIERLEKLYQVLCQYGVEKYVSFDLGMLSKYNYYTGVIFKVYTYGVGEPVAKGGRYDNLLGYFGKDAPAIGFAVVIDDLLCALTRQKVQPPKEAMTYLTYNASNYGAMLSQAKALRARGERAALIPEKTADIQGES